MLKLLTKIPHQEQLVRSQRILAPRVAGGRIRARVSGLLCELEPDPKDFEGWGIFSARGLKQAWLESEASPLQVDRYLRQLKSLRLILVQPLCGRSWLAVPSNRSEARQKLGLSRFSPLSIRGGASVGQAEPMVLTVHLVKQGRALEQVVARYDGANFWFEKLDRSADPTLPAFAAQELRKFTAPEQLRRPGLTPEFRAAYAMVYRPAAPPVRVRCSESRLRRALERGGGTLHSLVDQGDYWTTRWSTRDGEMHSSAILKTDLTVLSAGICLSGEDQKFDLQSLVGVVERRDQDA